MKVEFEKLLRQKRLLAFVLLVMTVVQIYLTFSGAYDTFSGISLDYFWQNDEYRQRKMSQEQQLGVAISELRKLTKGNTEGASFSTKTSGLRLPVTAGRVKRYKENMAEITGPKGAHVISIYDGKVVDIKRNRITNKYDVYVAHGEYITSYANLGTICVEKDQKVARNAQLGTIGSSVNVMTMETEYKLVFGIYPPNPGQKMRAEDCFK